MPAQRRPLPEHDEFEQYSQSEASQEPRDTGVNILVSIPESIEIKMVDATSLSDYEIWFFGSGALFSLLVGFLVAFMQEVNPAVSRVLGIATLVFFGLFVLCLIMTFVKRHTVKKKGKTIRLRTSNVLKDEKPNNAMDGDQE
jgi:hypothetical protein